jgi:hypothetical protein
LRFNRERATDAIFLTCDAFGVLPPVSSLSPAQAMYHYISGYTAKVAGTEMGVKEPSATFSACFGGPFPMWHPNKYAELLAAKMKQHGTRVWLVDRFHPHEFCTLTCFTDCGPLRKTHYDKNSSVKAWPKRLERGKSVIWETPRSSRRLRRPLTTLFESLETRYKPADSRTLLGNWDSVRAVLREHS